MGLSSANHILQVGNIYVFSMIGDMEFVGEIAAVNKPWIFLIKPLIMNRFQQPGGKIAVQWVPVLQGNPFLEPDQHYPINGNLVRNCPRPSKQLLDAYRQSRSSIIVNPALAGKVMDETKQKLP